MKKFIITGTAANGKTVQPVLTYNCADFTNAMQQRAMDTIQMFNGNKSIRYTITNA
jgi:hypothetical protein